MDKVLSELKLTATCFDDITITGVTDEEHLQIQTNVLKHLRHNGFRSKRRKVNSFKSLLSTLDTSQILKAFACLTVKFK